MDKRSILIGLHESEGLGWKRIEHILSRDENWVHALDFTATDWMERGLGAEIALRLSKILTKSWIEERLEQLDRKRISTLTIFDPLYPLLMKESVRPPWVLYGIGDMKLLALPSIAVVGTRLPTAYGRKVCTELTTALCRRGMVVVSGLAKGIDACCHEAALRSGGRTVAVLGTAIDVIYPPENASLYQMIGEQGLILSEYPIGTPGHPGLFPQRNRIIAGLTYGTVVVEADVRSGSLITADAALEAGRDVFAVPGQITSPKSRGTLGLIRQGAKMVTDAQDILEEYDVLLSNLEEKEEEIGSNDELTDEQRRIYHMLEQDISTFDELLMKTEWEFGHLHSVLLSLIMKKAVVQLPGSVYKVI
ncbi:DNA-processing protein DprA [Paenibacillus woosongensis]|uniref:DNA-processing protein DprA n=1 Tax=Paenibacillus woosongensis TaxID=307580 RepID=A0AA95IDL8_9BACL|nr:DNA-processing protein DprA [Paenibacillus woosongensis]WHX51080.1 DNA-processing protein DprA [Paenibacillus woosongensis]